ncbi:toll/interleukin-1 receptor domain-containing protein [Herbaspirillum rubrisubalbicans]|uniref:toll/interleukin-1 receptor domain-containing protein n=1 Tax=Herbaspirillum rubrisubalbicans TaxID=80842 RepID=UPI000DD30918|nr:toll/interleukin-1 receptor domain-containing protein [Herbaspirillum rubrisubalbicans]
MYRGYNLSINDRNFLSAHRATGQALITQQKNKREKAIDDYIRGDALDASQLQRDWFGPVDSNVFISHSHKDFELVTGIAGFLQNAGLSPFVDSFVWNHALDLIKELDEKYCYNDDRKTFSYQMRNRSTSHVYLMLSSALNKMIDRCECILFINTDSSVTANKLIKQGADFTASPWIYSEIETTRVIDKRRPLRLKNIVLSNEAYAYDEAEIRTLPEFHYELDMSHLTALNEREFHQWTQGAQRIQGDALLDLLYKNYN